MKIITHLHKLSFSIINVSKRQIGNFFPLKTQKVKIFSNNDFLILRTSNFDS